MPDIQPISPREEIVPPASTNTTTEQSTDVAVPVQQSVVQAETQPTDQIPLINRPESSSIYPTPMIGSAQAEHQAFTESKGSFLSGFTRIFLPLLIVIQVLRELQLLFFSTTAQLLSDSSGVYSKLITFQLVYSVLLFFFAYMIFKNSKVWLAIFTGATGYIIYNQALVLTFYSRSSISQYTAFEYVVGGGIVLMLILAWTTDRDSYQ